MNILDTEAMIESQRPGHQCGVFDRPCIHHNSMHCLACCIRDGQRREMKPPSNKDRLPEITAVLADIRLERRRQLAKWGEQHHPNGTGIGPYWSERAEVEQQMNATRVERGTLTWLDILAEEVYEAFAEYDYEKLRAELIQVAAVATAWAEDLDGRPTD